MTVRWREGVACRAVREGVAVLAGQHSRILTARAHRLVAPHLDGSATLDALVERLGAELSAAEVCFVVEQLTQAGLVVTGERLPEPHRAWEATGLQPAAIGRLHHARVQISTIGAVAGRVVEEVARQLHDLPGLADRPDQGGDAGMETAPVRVVIAEDYLHPQLAAVNAESLAGSRPWLLLKPAGAQPWVGPFFRPGATGCWECLAQRLRGHRRVEEYVRRTNAPEGAFGAAPAALPALVAVAAGLAAGVVAGSIIVGRSGLDGIVWTLDARSLSWERHHMVRRPQCSACGEAGPVSRTPVLMATRRADTVDGGLRVAAPEQSFERLRHHVSPVTGIVGSLLETPQDPEGDPIPAPTVLAPHAFTNDARDLDALRYSLQRIAGGKGVTLAQARTSALCEALERYSGVLDGTEPLLRASLLDLGEAAIEPNDCMLFSAAQYAASLDDALTQEPRRRTAVLPPGARRAPARFDPAAAIDWTPVWSLTHQRFRHLPAAYGYYGASHLAGAAFVQADSNGCAAGNVIEEAILQGFLELVERDATAIWWYNRIVRPAVDLSRWRDAAMKRVQDHLAAQERELWVLDITADLGIPTFAAVSCLAGPDRRHILLGFGAHFDARVALRRAVTEIMQSLALAPEGGSQQGPAAGAAALDWWRTARVEDHPYLAPCDDGPPRTPDAYAAWHCDDLSDAVRHCVDIARKRDLEMLVLDQTRPDVGLAVVKALVPGLRHFWPRFAPGRLYDVPVTLGWRSQPLDEAQLNPQPIYF
jgi:ribosomal protein S12 methylthiotransferase accessory factor